MKSQTGCATGANGAIPTRSERSTTSRPEKIVTASRLVKRGRSFPLCAPFEADGPWSGSFFRRNPIRLMVVHGGDEQIADHLEGFGGSVGEAFKTLYQRPMRFATT